MKKLLNKTKTAAALCMLAASLLFFTTTAKAQKGVTPNVLTCCVDAGADKTVTCGGTTTLGAVNTCTPNVNCPSAVHQSCCPTTYSWAPATGLNCTTCANPVATGVGYCGAPSITYTLTVTCACNGSPNTDQVVVTTNPVCCPLCCRIGHFENAQEEVAYEGIKVFPNPSKGNVTVKFDVINANTSIEVYNMEGALIMKRNNLGETNKTIELDLSHVAKGAYFIQVLSGEQGLLNKKIMIQ